MKKTVTPCEIYPKTPNCRSTNKIPQLSLNMTAVLRAFIEKGQQGISQTEAIKSFGDIDLYTTVWTLRKRGLKFKHSTEEIVNHTGTTKCTTRFSLISLSKGNRLLRLLERPPTQLKEEVAAND